MVSGTRFAYQCAHCQGTYSRYDSGVITHPHRRPIIADSGVILCEPCWDQIHPNHRHQ